MSSDDNYITALDALKETSLPIAVFIELLQQNEKTCPIFQNEKEMTIASAIKNFDLNLFGWASIRRNFYSRHLKSPHKYLRLINLEKLRFEDFKQTYQREISFYKNKKNHINEDKIIDEGKRLIIEQWEQILPYLKGAELNAAKSVILNLKGMQHIEIYTNLFPSKEIKKRDYARQYVSSLRLKAISLSVRHSLPRTPWLETKKE